MEKILISACLLGEKVRYNGRDARSNNPLLERWGKEGRLIVFCPEVAGGLPVPRVPAEIHPGDGHSVWQGGGEVVNRNGENVTSHFIEGARKTLTMVRMHHIKMAILKDHSPSCGVSHIYNGKFSGKLKAGKGVTTVLLEENGVKVFSEKQIDQAHRYLKKLETLHDS